MRQFQTACDTGTTSVRRTLLLLIGPKSSGKTQLKEILINQNDLNERYKTKTKEKKSFDIVDSLVIISLTTFRLHVQLTSIQVMHGRSTNRIHIDHRFITVCQQLFKILVKRKSIFISNRNFLRFVSFLDDHDRSKFNIQQHEYESQLVHNIILNLLKRRYELHTVHEKKDKVEFRFDVCFSF